MHPWSIFRLIFHISLWIAVLTSIVALIFLIKYLIVATRQLPRSALGPPGNPAPESVSLQLQAYERLVMLAERISPRQLISRLVVPDASARELQHAIHLAISAEFDHNISQQVYVSAAAWESIRNAKEQQLILINELADGLPAEATAAELGKRLITLEGEQGSNYPIQIALVILNAEARKLMNGNRL
jgi:hypothetical protein